MTSETTHKPPQGQRYDTADHLAVIHGVPIIQIRHALAVGLLNYGQKDLGTIRLDHLYHQWVESLKK